eukprot:1192152-Prorocentrum_minimum.AAC.3
MPVTGVARADHIRPVGQTLNPNSGVNTAIPLSKADGSTACSLRCFREERATYYDATVVDVVRHPHADDSCKCEFAVRWEAGPDKGTVSKVDIDHVCIVVKESISQHPRYAVWKGDANDSQVEESESGTFDGICVQVSNG